MKNVVRMLFLCSLVSIMRFMVHMMCQTETQATDAFASHRATRVGCIAILFT